MKSVLRFLASSDSAVSEADRLFAFGDGLEGGFSQSDFDGWWKRDTWSGCRNTILSTAPKIIRNVNESQLPYSLPY